MVLSDLLNVLVCLYFIPLFRTMKLKRFINQSNILPSIHEIGILYLKVRYIYVFGNWRL